MFENDIVSSCYCDMQAGGVAASDNAVGKTTAEMKTQSTYVGWDFTNVWGIDLAKNNNYPYLRIFDK